MTPFKQTQKEFVIERLKSTGRISRNMCLQNYITRLGAIVCQLNKEGWNLKGQFYEYENGKDFVYTSDNNTLFEKL